MPSTKSIRDTRASPNVVKGQIDPFGGRQSVSTSKQEFKTVNPCSGQRCSPPEPLIPTSFPKQPRQTHASNLFYLNNTNYLLVVDYYSLYIEVTTLRKSKSHETIIQALKTILARHRISDKLGTDNRRQNYC